jgi:hypothetical protein
MMRGEEDANAARIAHHRGTDLIRLLKFAAVPSALPLEDGLVLCAEGPIGSEFEGVKRTV